MVTGAGEMEIDDEGKGEEEEEEVSFLPMKLSSLAKRSRNSRFSFLFALLSSLSLTCRPRGKRLRWMGTQTTPVV